jgi:malic enzyme
MGLFTDAQQGSAAVVKAGFAVACRCERSGGRKSESSADGGKLHVWKKGV